MEWKNDHANPRSDFVYNNQQEMNQFSRRKNGKRRVHWRNTVALKTVWSSMIVASGASLR